MTTTNLPNGITNVTEQSTLGTYIMPDPTSAHTWFDDFDNYTAAEWVISETGSGTRDVGDIDGGVLVITNAGADNDRNWLQWSANADASVAETFTFTAGKQFWYKARFKIGDATTSDLTMGLYATDTAPITTASAIDVANGVLFYKLSGSTTLNHYIVATTGTTTAAGTLVNDTYVTAGFYYDGGSSMQVFFNDVRVATVATTNLPTTELAISFGVQNGDGNADVLSIDYIFASKER